MCSEYDQEYSYNEGFDAGYLVGRSDGELDERRVANGEISKLEFKIEELETKIGELQREIAFLIKEQTIG